ncbi:hypothetical protein D9O29_05545 [Pantoea vagans]|uniref:Bacteriophage CII protein n=2 Tax=Pantoea TaxID=53335 RepID=A0ABY3LHP5_9GAMM|nr:hypothetical protein D9O29_05545 [Pantoea vagans]
MTTNSCKNSDLSNVGRHLRSLALRAMFKTRQTKVARRLSVADSTILRRTEKFPVLMETLAASGIEDFLIKGEMKVSLDQYRWLMTVAIRYAECELERMRDTQSDASDTRN